KRTERWLKKAKRKYARTKTPIRRFYSFRHRARSWNQRRRIVVKIEVGPLGTNCRFVFTNRPGRAEQILPAVSTEESARIGSKNLSAILAPIGFPVIATAPMLFDLSSMPSLTNCLCCSVCTRFEPPTSLTLGWKPYGLSYSRSGLDLRVRLATCGFI